MIRGGWNSAWRTWRISFAIKGDLLKLETLTYGSFWPARAAVRNEILRADWRPARRTWPPFCAPNESLPKPRRSAGEALAIACQFATNDPGALVFRIADLAGVLEEEGRMADAESCYRDALTEQHNSR